MKCPICSSGLEERQVAPCYDCGHMPREQEECLNGEHLYNEFSIFGESVVLCDFCDADFGSYRPAFLGLPEGSPMKYPLMKGGRIESPQLSMDEYCPNCQHRLAFLVFLKNVRLFNSGSA